MNKYLITLSVIFAFLAIVIYINVEDYQMGEYDLYNCIYNNADSNGFTKNPYLIKKIQDECICFRNNNYTNILEAKCNEGEP